MNNANDRGDPLEGRRPLKAAVFGPTGLAGTGVVHAWLADCRVAEVRAITRRPIPFSDDRLREVQCSDLHRLESISDALTDLDAVCFCLGISASRVDRREYYSITHDLALAAANATVSASPEATFHFISGAGTSRSSRMNWARVKAETERELGEIGLGGCIHWRPAAILAAVTPDRMAWSQRVFLRVSGPLRSVRGFTVENTAIGQGMLLSTLEGRREGVIENREIRDLADRYMESRALSRKEPLSPK